MAKFEFKNINFAQLYAVRHEFWDMELKSLFLEICLELQG